MPQLFIDWKSKMHLKTGNQVRLHLPPIFRQEKQINDLCI
jgi:hypothetical protein